MRFHDPQWLLLLLALIPWALLLRRRERNASALAIADGARFAALPETLRSRCGRWLPYARVLLASLIIVALARPQAVERETKVRSEAVDLIIALDVSTSMLAEDLAGGEPRRNRLAVAKEVLGDFIEGRRGDRIGVVAFAARPYPAVPPTTDHAWLRAAVGRLQTGAIEDGTAVGDAILAALNRLRGASSPSAARSQAVVLITDGRSNTGVATPQAAAAVARAVSVRIHAIGIGSRGPAVIPVADPLGGVHYRSVEADLDEAILGEIAAATGGRYFRADDKAGLAQVFAAIDRLEKRPLEETVYFTYQELFVPLLLGALALLVAELSLRATLLRTLP